jgi:hypothetical protein
MRDRQSTPDVLGNLMSGIEIKQESNKAGLQPFNKAINEQKEEEKEKATFNLPKELLGDLERKWIEIRHLLKTKQISKTWIVEIALEMAFSEFNVQKQESNLYCKALRKFKAH